MMRISEEVNKTWSCIAHRREHASDVPYFGADLRLTSPQCEDFQRWLTCLLSNIDLHSCFVTYLLAVGLFWKLGLELYVACA